jgi:hypothetical protein
MCKRVVSFTPQSLYHTENVSSTHWIGGRFGSRTGLDAVEEIKILLLLGIEIKPSSLSHDAIQAELFQLRNSG